MRRAIWVNAERTIGNLVDEEAGSVTVIEPGSSEWADFLALDPLPFVAPPVPDQLEAERSSMVASRFQTRAALLMAGLLSDVEAKIAQAEPIVQLAWADAVEFRRDSPTLAALAKVLGLTDLQVDDLFRQAMTIRA
jgi:hypothetical protein